MGCTNSNNNNNTKNEIKTRDLSEILVKPDDNRYDSLRHGFNLRFLGSALLLKQIYVCESSEEVFSVLKSLINTNDIGKTPRITIRGGGHCYEGFVEIGSDVIIDISCNKKCETIDLTDYGYKTKVLSIGSGITNWEGVKYLFKEHGVCLPGGSCYSVGFGGHICGGGYGLLSRKFGLTVDYLIGVELVWYDYISKSVRCTKFIESPNNNDDNNDADNDDDTKFVVNNKVVWAHKGCGGGNYGVITKYYFTNLPAAPSKVLLMQRAWKWCTLRGSPIKKDKNGFIYDYKPFRHFMNAYGEFWVNHVGYKNGVKISNSDSKQQDEEKYNDSDDDLDYGNMWTLLNINTDVDEKVSEVSITVQWAIDEKDKDVTKEREALEAFCNKLVPNASEIEYEISINPNGDPYYLLNTTDIVEESWLTATMNLNISGPSRCGKYKSSYMLNGFTECEIDTIIHFMDNYDNVPKIGLLEIDSYGGAINKRVSDATAVPQRSSVMKLQYQVYWTLLEEEQNDDIKNDISTSIACIEWINNFYQAMYKEYPYKEPYPDNKHVDGCYVNYCDIDLVDWSKLYYGDNYKGLQDVKKYLDHEQIFWHRQSIKTDEMENKSKTLPWPKDAPKLEIEKK